MPDNPKILGIIILIINLVVLGPTSWIIKDLRTDITELKAVARNRHDDLHARLDDLLINVIDRTSYEQDMSQLKTRINLIEGRLYDLYSTR